MSLKLCKNCWLYFDSEDMTSFKGKLVCKDCLALLEQIEIEKEIAEELGEDND